VRCLDSGGTNMKRIAVFRRVGQQGADNAEGEACLVSLHRAGIPAHVGKAEEGYNLFWVEEDADVERAVTILRRQGLM
jgi:hypothetical protein